MVGYQGGVVWVCQLLDRNFPVPEVQKGELGLLSKQADLQYVTRPYYRVRRA